MKFHIPEDYSDFEGQGFSKQNDVFSRKELATTIQSIVENAEGGLVIGLDSPWGEGKTSFVKMLQHEMSNTTPFIYFDAFRSDYYHEPIIALAGEIYKTAGHYELAGDAVVRDFANQVEKLAKSSLKVLLQIVLRVAAHKLVGASNLDELTAIASGISDDVSNATSESAANESLKESQLELYQNEEGNVKAVHIALTKLAEDMLVHFNNRPGAQAKNIVFVIDELDRCRPDYALALLEAVKHLFSAPNIVFMLVVNRSQLEASIKGVYGPEFDATLYLEKFIHLNMTLPGSSQLKTQTPEAMLRYIKVRCEKLNIPIVHGRDLAQCITFIGVSVRQVNKAIVAYGILRNSPLSEYLFAPHISTITLSLCVISVSNHKLFKKLAYSHFERHTIGYDEFADFFQRDYLQWESVEVWKLLGGSSHDPIRKRELREFLMDINPEWRTLEMYLKDACAPLLHISFDGKTSDQG